MVAEVFQILRLQSTSVTLKLIGDGPLKGELTMRLQERCLSDGVLSVDSVSGSVHSVGFTPDVAAALHECDVLFVSSQMEAFSLAALEAMAAGVAVVAPRVGGIPELLTDNETGVLYEPGDVAGAAAALKAVLGDDAFRRRLTERAFEVAKGYDVNAGVAAYERLYLRLLSRGRTTI